MKIFRSLLADLLPIYSVIAQRLALPLLLVGAELLLIHPCLGQGGTWTATGSLTNARTVQTATLLPDGKVLVAGGSQNGTVGDAGAEVYDPTSGTWTATGSLATARFFHTATLLPDGKVLVAGGTLCCGLTWDSAELYDLANGAWTPTGDLGVARQGHTATLLPNGQVLVAGGLNDSGWLASAELYDPA